METETTADSSAPAASGPSQGVRTTITLLLLFHFAALLVAVSGNFGARSGLRRQLQRVPLVRPYLQLLHMDTAYNFHFIFGTAEDWDYSCEILADTEGYTGTEAEAAQLKKIELMPEGAWPGSRRLRYRMLALNTGLFEGDDDLEPHLPYALSNGMLNEAGIESGTHRFRCRRQMPMGLYNYATIQPELRDPYHPDYFENVYQASLLRSDGVWGVSKVVSAGERTRSRSNRENGQ